MTETPGSVANGPVEIPARLCNLPPLNAIVNQLIALSADPDSDLPQMAAVMEKDPAFAADVLFLANSALFGLRDIHSVRRAVCLLGMERIKALAVTAAMRRFTTRGGPLLPQCWHHSAACAIISQEIAPLFSVNADTAYTVGLMHDIGRLGLLKTYPAEYSPILFHAYENVEEVLALEQAALKVDHATAGAWMVKTWNFPSVFAEACQHHHEPIEASDSPLLQGVKVSCRLAAAIGYAAVHYKNELSYGDLMESLPGHISRGAFPLEEKLRMDVEERLTSFGPLAAHA